MLPAVAFVTLSGVLVVAYVLRQQRIHDAGVTSIIALGADLTANAAAWEEWSGEGDWPDVPPVRNFARTLGLVTEGEDE